MSWRLAAELARQRAADARREADGCGIDEARAAAFQRHLRSGDPLALVAWTRHRKAQELEQFADECDRRRDTEITVLERGRKT